MGRMKNVYMDIMQNGTGIPEDATIGDLKRMQELQIFEWKEYEQQQEKDRQQQFESENSGESAKVSEITREFTEYFKEARKEERKRNKQ
jgi:O6-methylguanine-DNA--protein-cysteine methyltransferase